MAVQGGTETQETPGVLPSLELIFTSQGFCGPYPDFSNGCEGELISGEGSAPIVKVSPHLVVKYGQSVKVTEAETLLFMERVAPGIPAPRLHACYKIGPYDRDMTEWRSAYDTYIVMDFVEGECLDKVWDDIDEQGKAEIATQLHAYTREMRSITQEKESTIGSVAHGPLQDWIFENHSSQGPFANEEEFNAALVEIHESVMSKANSRPLIAGALAQHSHKVVLTHGDLQGRNIMVVGNRISAILDWETCGWLPEYWEFAKCFAVGGWKKDWPDFILQVLDPYPCQWVLYELIKRHAGIQFGQGGSSLTWPSPPNLAPKTVSMISLVGNAWSAPMLAHVIYSARICVTPEGFEAGEWVPCHACASSPADPLSVILLAVERIGCLSAAPFDRSYHPSAMRRAARVWLVATPLRAVFCLVLTLFILAAYLVRSISFRDPGSWFFDPDVAYDHQYTSLRVQQAKAFVSAIETEPPFRRRNQSASVPKICVGVPSIARKAVRYEYTVIGSLLAGLTQEERDEIHLIVFIPHTDPTSHPAFSEKWLEKLADDTLLYNLTQGQSDHITALEAEGGLMREKGLFDYTYLLKACLATGAPYIAMIEDDVIAMDGWYHRTLAALQQAEIKTVRAIGSRDFLYLRLFYTEEFLGWNREDWHEYAFWSVCCIIAVCVILFWIRFSFPRTKQALTPFSILAVCVALVPLAIALFFAAGRVTVLPLPAGVNPMNNYGCCAQALVFPQEKAQELVGWYEKTQIGFADVLTEQYADEHDELRWALTPSVIQHIGRKSSKWDDTGEEATHDMPMASKIWNFAFESYDAKKLKTEHYWVTQA
nr:hypothetical protein CFP56_07570 [Quercus suber]